MAVMDLTTGPGLAAAIAAFLAKDDLTDAIPGFVRLFESAAGRELRLREQLKRKVATITAGTTYFDLPADFAEAKRVAVTAPSSHVSKLDVASEDNLFDIRAGCPQGGVPTHFDILGGTVEVAPAPSADITVELAYWATIPALDVTTAGATNWLLQKAPDLYLYGALLSSAPYLVEDERLPTWTALAASIIQSLSTEAARVETSGGRLIARRRGF